MLRRLTRRLGLFPPLALALLAPFSLAGQTATSLGPDASGRLREEILDVMRQGGIPSLTVALVDRTGVLWSGAFGYANVWSRTPARVETVYQIGSTFKPQSAAVLLGLMAEEGLGLDDSVRLRSGLAIGREDPGNPVTFRHLLTHTSGLPAAFGAHPLWGDDAPRPLERYLRETLSLIAAPGEAVVYSNVGFSLVGWLVERISGTSFREFVRRRLWEPLGMTHTAFVPTPEMQERLAVPYVRDEAGRPVPTGQLRADVWPAAVVYGTVLDQARWLRFSLGDGTTENGRRLLPPGMLAAMETLQDSVHAGLPMAGGWGFQDTGFGLGWWTTRRGATHYFAHAGGVPGYSSFLMGDRERGLGIVLLSNADQAQGELERLAGRALDLLRERRVAEAASTSF